MCWIYLLCIRSDLFILFLKSHKCSFDVVWFIRFWQKCVQTAHSLGFACVSLYFRFGSHVSGLWCRARRPMLVVSWWWTLPSAVTYTCVSCCFWPRVLPLLILPLPPCFLGLGLAGALPLAPFCTNVLCGTFSSDVSSVSWLWVAF